MTEVNKKKIAEYQRVSSGGQDLLMQVSANKQYLSRYNKHDILKFIDYDVSATKLTLEKRPSLNRLLQTIREGKISTVVIYERDRLARDVYEYIKIAKNFYQHNIEVVFTASNAPPFSEDIFLETWYGLYAQFEGQKIRTRLYDTQKRYPSKMIGYKKVKQKNEKTFYKAQKEIKTILQNLFQEFSLIESREDLIEVILTYQSKLSRTNERILDILRTPFFAAHYTDSDGHFYPLEHVEAIISLELFKQVQKKRESLEKMIDEVKLSPHKEALILPICGVCMNELTFQKGKIGQEGKYVCKKHKKISIPSEELDAHLKQSVKLYIQTLSPKKLESLCINSINKVKQRLHQQGLLYKKKIEEKCIETCIQNHIKMAQKTLNKNIIEIKLLRDKLIKTDDQLTALEMLKEEVTYITSLLKDNFLNKLNNTDYKDLANLLIDKAILQDDSLMVHYYFNEFQDRGPNK
ncbi:hypothetical protein CD798_09865 [Bacillaceae bacterium SAOS 7]|nr:hypothetical protein CD798_09865 [Bacillaceae bacterium SAOS 7]